jgi:hypothetical protein
LEDLAAGFFASATVFVLLRVAVLDASAVEGLRALVASFTLEVAALDATVVLVRALATDFGATGAVLGVS